MHITFSLYLRSSRQIKRERKKKEIIISPKNYVGNTR